MSVYYFIFFGTTMSALALFTFTYRRCPIAPLSYPVVALSRRSRDQTIRPFLIQFFLFLLILIIDVDEILISPLICSI
jgi:hypothetical protein